MMRWIWVVLSALAVVIIWTLYCYCKLSQEIKNVVKQNIRKIGIFIVILFITLVSVTSQENISVDVSEILIDQPLVLPADTERSATVIIEDFLGQDTAWRAEMLDFLNDTNNTDKIIINNTTLVA